MNEEKRVTKGRDAKFIHGLITLILMVAVIFTAIVVFGSDPQVPLIVGCVFAGLMAMYLGYSWEDILEGMMDSISKAIEAVLILLIIGMLIGSWIACGTIPTIIYYGLKIISPKFFLPLVVVLSTLVAMATGSWGCVGTIGLSFMGIGSVMGIPMPIVAGSVISGAYAGEMLSPISDASNLAAAISRSSVFKVVRGRMKEAITSLAITVVTVAIIGLKYSTGDSSRLEDSVNELMNNMSSQFNITFIALIPLAVVIVCIIIKWPAIPAMLAGAFVAIGLGAFLQGKKLIDLISTCYYGYESKSGNENLDALLSAGGMESMFYCISIVLIAMAFGGIMQRTGQMRALVRPIVSRIKGDGVFVSLTVLTGFFMNGLLPDQYLGISLPGQMYGEEYKKRSIGRSVLGSTSLAGSRTSPLIPWNTCGIYCMTVLGVSPISYAPFAFFCILTPLITIGSSMMRAKKLSEHGIN